MKFLQKIWAVVVHAFNPSTQEAGGPEFKDSPVYRASPRKARVTEKPCLKKQKQNILTRSTSKFITVLISISLALVKYHDQNQLEGFSSAYSTR